MLGDADGVFQVWGITERQSVTLEVFGVTERQSVTLRRGMRRQLEVSVGPWVQIERNGVPGVSTVFIPGPKKDLYNLGTPDRDALNFGADIVNSLRSLGTNDLNIGILAAIALPDSLKVNLREPPGFPNGRRPEDDVIDTLLFFIFNQTVVTDGVNANDRPFLPAFPYLAPPQQPPG